MPNWPIVKGASAYRPKFYESVAYSWQLFIWSFDILVHGNSPKQTRGEANKIKQISSLAFLSTCEQHKWPLYFQFCCFPNYVFQCIHTKRNEDKRIQRIWALKYILWLKVYPIFLLYEKSQCSIFPNYFRFPILFLCALSLGRRTLSVAISKMTSKTLTFVRKENKRHNTHSTRERELE